jgi:hypothetical protein
LECGLGAGGLRLDSGCLGCFNLEFEQPVGDGRGHACMGGGIRWLALPFLLCLPIGHLSCCGDLVREYRVKGAAGAMDIPPFHS